MARQNLEAFLGRGLDAIVVNSAGCGATMKEYGHLLAPDDASAVQAHHDASAVHAPHDTSAVHARHDASAVQARLDASATEFASLTRDVNEFLAAIPLAPFTTAVNRHVTLQESCHLSHAQRIREAPRRLLAAIPGLQMTEMAHPDQCCGSAGLYMLTEPEMSTRILDAKMQDIASTDASTIVTANPGCMLQLTRGTHRAAYPAAVKHVVELLDEAYGAPRLASTEPMQLRRASALGFN